MIKDYDEQLNAFSVPENRDQAEAYFEKYWIDSDEYQQRWLPIQRSIFNDKARHLPDLMFNDGYEIFPLVGGNIFTSKDDFLSLQNCMRETGDTSFALLENEKVVIEFYGTDGGWRTTPSVRFKFPADISWEELMSGGSASTVLFQVQGAIKDYFMFGDSGTWGRYVANDYASPTIEPAVGTPLNIMGFKREFSELFRKQFEKVQRLNPEITSEVLLSEWLPDSYKHLPGALG
jgi:hypothetical protein